MSDFGRTDACELLRGVNSACIFVRIRLTHDSQSSPPETKKSVLPCRGSRPFHPHAAGMGLILRCDGDRRGIPLQCSSPSYAVGAHNFSTTWLSQGGSAICTRNKDSARRGPGPGDLRSGRDRDRAGGLGASGRLYIGRLPIRHHKPPPWRSKAGLKLCLV